MTLATPGQTLLPADYWEQGDAQPKETKEEQRSLLRRIETGRLKFNPQAETIRTVHVAWGFIRLENEFLLYHREDDDRPAEKSHVPLGGRFKLSDAPVESQARREILKEILNPESEIVGPHINRTLEREFEEEAGLSPVTHYTPTRRLTIPFRSIGKSMGQEIDTPTPPTNSTFFRSSLP